MEALQDLVMSAEDIVLHQPGAIFFPWHWPLPLALFQHLNVRWRQGVRGTRTEPQRVVELRLSTLYVCFKYLQNTVSVHTGFHTAWTNTGHITALHVQPSSEFKQPALKNYEINICWEFHIWLILLLQLLHKVGIITFISQWDKQEPGWGISQSRGRGKL